MQYIHLLHKHGKTDRGIFSTLKTCLVIKYIMCNSSILYIIRLPPQRMLCFWVCAFFLSVCRSMLEWMEFNKIWQKNGEWSKEESKKNLPLILTEGQMQELWLYLQCDVIEMKRKNTINRTEAHRHLYGSLQLACMSFLKICSYRSLSFWIIL